MAANEAKAGSPLGRGGKSPPLFNLLPQSSRSSPITKAALGVHKSRCRLVCTANVRRFATCRSESGTHVAHSSEASQPRACLTRAKACAGTHHKTRRALCNCRPSGAQRRDAQTAMLAGVRGDVPTCKYGPCPKAVPRSLTPRAAQ
jgi:hypothetical protein